MLDFVDILVLVTFLSYLAFDLINVNVSKSPSPYFPISGSTLLRSQLCDRQRCDGQGVYDAVWIYHVEDIGRVYHIYDYTLPLREGTDGAQGYVIRCLVQCVWCVDQYAMLF